MRVEYVKYWTALPLYGDLVVKKRGGGERIIKSGKWWINRNTPVGEDSEVWEKMPHFGQREISHEKIIAIITPSGSDSVN